MLNELWKLDVNRMKPGKDYKINLQVGGWGRRQVYENYIFLHLSKDIRNVRFHVHDRGINNQSFIVDLFSHRGRLDLYLRAVTVPETALELLSSLMSMKTSSKALIPMPVRNHGPFLY